MGLRAVQDIHRVHRRAHRAAPRARSRVRPGFEDAKISLPRINQRVKTLAAAQSADIADRLRSEGVTLIAGRGELVDDVPGMARHRIKVTTPEGSTSVVEADVVLIATGASPRVLPGAEPDGERILNWRQLYDLDALPEHLVVVGSGVTGAEFVQRLYRARRDGHRGGQPRPDPARTRTPTPRRCWRSVSPSAA